MRLIDEEDISTEPTHFGVKNSGGFKWLSWDALKSLLEAFFAPLSRTVGAAGLATGGGNLYSDLTITVAPATQAEAEAGEVNNKAMTPLLTAQALNARAVPPARTISTAGLAVGGGALSANRTITVPVATQQEAEIGSTVNAAMTPWLTAQAIASFAVPKARAISTAGLATGGGDLSTTRTITVPVASQAEAQAGTANDKAMTPLRVAQAISALSPAPDLSGYLAAANLLQAIQNNLTSDGRLVLPNGKFLILNDA